MLRNPTTATYDRKYGLSPTVRPLQSVTELLETRSGPKAGNILDYGQTIMRSAEITLLRHSALSLPPRANP